MLQLNLNANTKKKLKIILCGTGVIVAMSLVATTPSLTRDSFNGAANPGRAAALKAPGVHKINGQQASIDLTSAGSNDSSSAGTFSLQGSAQPTPSNSAAGSDTGSAGPTPASTPTASTDPDVLYPVDPIPKCQYYKNPGGMQPYACPVCEGASAADAAIRYPCGCGYGSGGVQIMCVDPSQL